MSYAQVTSVSSGSPATGKPTVIATDTKLAQTTTLGSTTLYTPTVTGFYRFSYYIIVPTAFTTGTAIVTISYTDIVGARTNFQAGAVQDLTDTGNFDWAASNTLQLKLNTAITYACPVTNGSGDGTYNLYTFLEQLA
jgi:hypothetical protein